MIDPQTQALLQSVLRRETRTLLRYIGDAFPWTRTADDPALSRLHGLVAREREATTALGRYLTLRRVPPPHPGSYPGGFTSWNFIALDALLPRLVRAQEADVLALERDLPALALPEARGEVEKLLAVKRATLDSLRLLAASGTPAASET